ncbi:DUF2637 domain-containing protein [Glycomyces tarimensis]
MTVQEQHAPRATEPETAPAVSQNTTTEPPKWRRLWSKGQQPKRTPKARKTPKGKQPSQRRQSRQKPQPQLLTSQRRGASAVSWLAFGLGIIVSVAANIGHIWFVTRPEAEAMISAMVFAGFWPIALAVAVEVLSRVSWPGYLKWPGIAGTAAVGTVALVVSYRHMNGLLLHFGESDLSAALGPIGVDGLLIVGGFAILAIGETNRSSRTRQHDHQATDDLAAATTTDEPEASNTFVGFGDFGEGR